MAELIRSEECVVSGLSEHLEVSMGEYGWMN